MPSSARSRATALLLSAAMLLAACRDTAGPEPRIQPPPSPEAPRVVGLMQLTITGVGTSAVSATLTPVGVSGGPNYVLTPIPGGTPPGTLQIRRLSASSVDVGTRGAGGQRYLQAIFEVRNADLNGNPYPTPRQNVTFMPVGTAATTFPGTPVATFRKQDGTAADPAIAQQLIPTGAVALDGGGGLVSQYPDVLQVFTEEEVEQVAAPPAVTNKFPYGFVVRHATSTSTRTLPANPGPEQYDGRVTFAYRMPLQPAAENDPFTISILVLAVEDSEARITQSLEEQTPAGQAAFEARAASLGATTVRILSTGAYTGSAVVERMCGVRVAGTRSNPSTWLDGAAGQWTGFTPNPYAAGTGNFLARNGSITATFSRCVRGVGPGTFVVNGMQSARHFLAGGYTGEGTSTVTTPLGSFFPGEEVEVTLTASLTAPARVARFRVASGAARGHFSHNVYLGDDPRQALFAELTGDGLQDMLTVGSGARLTLFVGTGGGGFNWPGTQLSLSSVPTSVAVGDLSGDGILDIAASVGNSVAVLYANGSGGFGAPVYHPVGTDPMEVVIGDLNADGWADLATANSGSHNVSVLLNTQTSSFAPAAAYGSLSSPRALVRGDVDGDLVPDLVVADNNGLTILRGQGAGVFAFAGTLLVSSPSTVEAAHLDGDGILDLVSASSTGNSVVVFKGTGGGGFSTASYAVGTGPRSVAIGDLNGDGLPDLAVANTVSNDATLLLNAGSAAFAPGGTVAAGNQPYSVVVHDVNADGRLDLATANLGSDDVRIRLNSGGTFPALFRRDVAGNPQSVAVGDLNGDGWLDVAAARNNGVGVLLNAGDGTLLAEAAYPTAISAIAVALGDVDGDGRLDIVVANYGPSTVSVLRGTGGGAFAAPVSYPVGNGPYSVAIGDLNGDGRLDLATANLNNGSVSVLLGTGGGGFAAAANYPAGGSAISVAVADMNADGWMDLVTGNYQSFSVSVLLNTSHGVFAAPATYSEGAGHTVNAVAVGDLNADGLPDVASAIFSFGVSVRLNTGGGVLGAPTYYDPETVPYDVEIGDLNGDGLMDLATANVSEPSPRVRLGTGGGAFGPAFIYWSAWPPGSRSIAMGDITGDGRLDLVVAEYNALAVSVLPGVAN